MKIVINRCYGGFGLSYIAQKEYLKLKGKEFFMYDKDLNRLVENLDDKSIFTNVSTIDLGKKTSESLLSENLHYNGDLDRTDEQLIQVVESLGEEADGCCASLDVVEIPDGVQYEIENYDGYESIHEIHRSW